MQTPSNREQLLQLCLDQLVAVAPELDKQAISPAHSLTEELMLDSFLLASFVERLEREFPDVDMTQWFMAASRGGEDTLAGLVDFLVDAATPSTRPAR